MTTMTRAATATTTPHARLDLSGILVPVPAAHRATYDALAGYLDSFTPGLRAYSPPTFASELFTANSQNGLSLLLPGAADAARLHLDRLVELGLGGVTVTAHEDVFRHPQAADFRAFYRGVAADVRARGLKLLVESTASFTYDYAGRGLTYAQYKASRRAALEILLDTMAPDYLSAGDEPDSEAANTGFAQIDTPGEYAAFIADLTDGLTGGTIPVGAGVGSWQSSRWAAALCALPIDFLGIHVYPVYGDFLEQAASHATAAAAAGKRAVIGEAWLMKRTAAEAGVGIPEDYYRRDVYTFWEPLDQQFLLKAVGLCLATGIEWLSPFWGRYLFAQFVYDSANRSWTFEQGQAEMRAAAAAALAAGTVGATGRFYGALAARVR